MSKQLDKADSEALDQLVSLLSQYIPNDMHWKDNGTVLASSFHSSSDTDYREVGSDLPYARRRDMGFDGTDSLGRTYHDAGAYYMQASIDQLAGDILQTFLESIGGEL